MTRINRINRINRIVLSNPYYPDHYIGAQCAGLQESVLIKRLSFYIEEALLSSGIDKILNLNTEEKPPQYEPLPTDLAIILTFPHTPKGESMAWNGSKIYSSLKTVFDPVTEQVNKWGSSSSVRYRDCKVSLLSRLEIRFRPFYLDGHDSLILAERLENLGQRFGDSLGRSLLVYYPYLKRVVSQAPEGSKR